MPVIIGYLVSLVCVFGVFIMHGGNIGVVLKALPFEMATIGGAAFGALGGGAAAGTGQRGRGGAGVRAHESVPEVAAVFALGGGAAGAPDPGHGQAGGRGPARSALDLPEWVCAGQGRRDA